MWASIWNAAIRNGDTTGSRNEPARDSSGYVVFSAGEAGAAHVMAHRMLDEARFETGYALLGEWLDGRTGSSSDWIHLQFHMAVFELAVDDWDAAYVRFVREVLPLAETTERALTDAPALLWRLMLTAPGSVDLPWEALRRTAVRRMERPSKPFVELHNLLALAGAGDVAGIDRWLKLRAGNKSPQPERLVERMAAALRSYVIGDYRRASAVFRDIVPRLGQVGGSRAQNELFSALELSCRQRSNHVGLYAAAA